MKKFLVLSMIMIQSCFYQVFAQQDTTQADTLRFWKISGMASLNFSQNSFSDNWQSGGESAVSGLGLFNISAKYRNNNSFWESVLDIKYGLTKLANQNIRKTDDHFEMMTKYGYKASEKWYYSIMLDFNTQMTNGYHETNPDSVISKFMAPAYLLTSVGMDYKPGNTFSLFLSPVTGKITFVLDDTFSDEGRFGVDKGKKVRFEFGASLSAGFDKEVFKNVSINSKLGLFYNYLDKPQLDVDWAVLINMKINQFLSSNLITRLIYDKDQIDQVQFKEILGVGLTYKF